MISKSLPFATIATIAAISFLLISWNSQVSFGQGDPGGIDPGGGDTGGIDPGGIDLGGIDPGTIGTGDGNDLLNNAAGTGGVSGGGGGGGGLTGGDFSGVDDNFFDNLEQVIEPDARRRGFVGVTADTIGGGVDLDSEALGYVGPTAEFLLDGNTSAGATGRGATGDGGAQRELQNTGGFTVQRRGLRSRTRPAFRIQPVANNFISTRFQNRLQRQPATRNVGQGVNIKVERQTAILSGSVSTQQEADMIIGQLRLEPGVYKIDNQLFVGSVSSRQ